MCDYIKLVEKELNRQRLVADHAQAFLAFEIAAHRCTMLELAKLEQEGFSCHAGRDIEAELKLAELALEDAKQDLRDLGLEVPERKP
jgi:biotin operon repressor